MITDLNGGYQYYESKTKEGEIWHTADAGEGFAVVGSDVHEGLEGGHRAIGAEVVAECDRKGRHLKV